ncbi:uncharacterized protein MESR4 isoform X2 [Venturia canescens]|uniref:uncharacterized protein MESR4 isoform X2 n=1 Tax=Venturia canescens TaxID=32260 RepID=UPI001C9CA186|nr:uncharacterized protein LOC122414532 isoform X2 [Venturia canescens]
MEDEDVEGRNADVRKSTEDRKEDLGNEETAEGKETKPDTSSGLGIATESGKEEAKVKENEEKNCVERNLENSPLRNNVGGKKRREKRSISTSITREVKRGKITEYAQYLGLQPASNKTNCATCRGTTTTNSCDPSMLNQCTCPPGIMTQSTGYPSPGTSDSCSSNPATTTPATAQNSANNFRITRKVYLCAACGTYFENWNLFLHMREIHKRHICLFCLGMFGQAERLSYHLTKKHNVPETTFTSVEDFYNVFKGSCYLICCTCEKVFAETDNFYNHFCSPVQKGRGTVASEICTFCRQSVNNHSSMCTGGQTETRESSQTTNVVSPGVPSVPGKPVDAKSLARSNKRLLKNNRLKHNDFSALTSYQQRMAMLYAKKPIIRAPEPPAAAAATAAAAEIVEDSSTFGNFETGKTTTTPIPATTASPTPIPTTPSINATSSDAMSALRDTVSETIMEVSKCTDESRLKEMLNEPCVRSGVIEVNSSTIKIVSSPSPSFSSSSLSSPIRQQNEPGGCYDSVTETIMEVSRCHNAMESSEDEDDDKEDSHNRFGRNETSSRDSDADALVMDEPGLSDNEEAPSIDQHYDDRLKNSLKTGTTNERRRKRRKTMHRRNEENARACDTDETSSGSDNEAASPNHESPNTASSIFRSRQQHEAERERSISQSSTSPEKESQATSVSFTTVNTTDRSLVIKICTNRNARFSVSRSTANGNNESHDTSRESEENNNAEDSASESKFSNHSERGDRDSVNSHEEEEEEEEGEEGGDEDEGQSDNNSVKLSIDDTKQVEDEPKLSADNIPPESSDSVPVENAQTPKPEATENSTEDIRFSGEKISEEAETMETKREDEEKEEKTIKSSLEVETDGIILASEDVPSIDLNVEGILESMEIEDLLKRCISAASGYCVYCNHARHIAVNGKQLGLHVLAEHRFQPQHPAIIIQREQLIVLLKKSLNEVETKFFNLDSYDSTNGTYHIAAPRIFECFHCRYHSLVHKEIYLHNRKMHQKTILICIMCKSTFYSYSELLCHLCPGVYSPNINVTYRCCLCPVTNLPSAFRLMVHLRKRHHSCDVCLESTGNQQRLSNHVWKHKLHHLCYRCGIAYRNKPDITKHLFWKHGTESVLCKKCLQKKWPHVYHFCIPPTAFVCEECTSSFTRAVALKVHKRLHSGDRPYGCSECDERFISKKLATKHETRHREPEIVQPEVADKEKNGTATNEEFASDKGLVESLKEETTKAEPAILTTEAATSPTTGIATAMETTTSSGTTATPEGSENAPAPVSETKEPKEPVKKVVDVYDLPPLNLSSDSDSDVEETPAPEVAAKDRADGIAEEQSRSEAKTNEALGEPGWNSSAPGDPSDRVVDVELNEEEKEEEAQIMDGIWDNFKSYAASLEQREAIGDEKKEEELSREDLCKIILADHDYCVVYTDKSGDEEAKEEDDPTKNEDNASTMEGEHDYGHKVAKSPSNTSVVLNCDSDTNTAALTGTKRKKEKSPKKKLSNDSSSESSSDSDSSSCSCGTNCSCSSSSTGSSSSSSSSSDSDSSASESSPKKQSARKERRRDKEKEDKEVGAPTSVENAKNDATKVESPEEKVEERLNVEEETERKVNVEEPGEPHVEVNDRPASPQLIFRESDLETDETETDEDFYDEHPQQLANKLLAEKRNQLMLLATVAPPVTDTTILHQPVAESLNNGILEPAIGGVNSVETVLNTSVEDDENGAALAAVTPVPTATSTASRKRVKMKKRRKTERPKTTKPVAPASTPVAAPTPPPTVESIKLNIPKSFYDKKPKKFGSKAAPLITVVPSRSSTPSSMMNSSQHSEPGPKLLNDKAGRLSLGGSGSENENKRSSKRKRVPKRFYGDSSEDEATHQHHHEPQQQHYTQPNLKWRKVEQPSPVVPSVTIKAPVQQQQQQQRVVTSPLVVPPSNANYATKSVTLRLSGFDRPMERIVPIVTGPSESEEQAESSSAESSEAEERSVVEAPRPSHPPAPVPHLVVPNSTHIPPSIAPAPGVAGGPERSVNLYCYCQCPYDEVSEMIACDGNDCRIEWFHFECVGIMVPPKGKWYCPDCRKKDSSLVNDDFLE